MSNESDSLDALNSGNACLSRAQFDEALLYYRKVDVDDTNRCLALIGKSCILYAIGQEAAGLGCLHMALQIKKFSKLESLIKKRLVAQTPESGIYKLVL